ncbi:poly(3-hydroxybutyrate) depolymerase [Lacihabitans sp. LS3-19]|uniref:alpha/beta hydrolase family esterase n=1 Tax=Lacihabitans sp. LS3-19 TaxID=2487335 RepID=UPI0020CC821F|nr:prolyl oligopeptidase family serine peptidase [Lacihabitans sp. LS3-19]MCP9770509.1 poly(3-hydroxybutyrate) depolymerase [Lacihabitans sp. LS3-19]
MKKRLIFFFACLVFVSSKAQTLSDSLLIDNNYRSFYFVPTNLPNASLIFVLHGSQGDGIGIRNNPSEKNLEALAPKENILMVYPNGYKRYWNECRKTANSAANLENINEEAFFGQMIDYFKSKYAIDDKKVFAIGTSGGGHMAYKLALTMPERFRAITAFIANLPDTNNLDCIEKHVAKPVMIINGTADNINPFEGGEVKLGPKVNLGYVRSTSRTFNYWADLAGYKGEPKMEKIPDNDPADGKTIEKYTYKSKRKPEVTLYKVIGGKHDYPNDIDIYLEAWKFFQRN